MNWLDRLLAWIKLYFAAREAARAKKAEEKPAPAPEPAPAPQPAPAVDELDPRIVAWDEPLSPASWPITATITSARFTGDGVEAQHSGTEGWPVRRDGGDPEKPSIGNWLLIAECMDGRYHGAAIEWLGKGRTRVTGKRFDGTDNIHGILSTWRPTRGETIYLMLSTVVRASPFTTQERSQIVAVKIP